MPKLPAALAPRKLEENEARILSGARSTYLGPSSPDTLMTALNSEPLPPRFFELTLQVKLLFDDHAQWHSLTDLPVVCMTLPFHDNGVDGACLLRVDGLDYTGCRRGIRHIPSTDATHGAPLKELGDRGTRIYWLPQRLRHMPSTTMAHL